MSANRLSFVRDHWNLPLPLMVVSSLLFVCSYVCLLSQSSRTFYVVGEDMACSVYRLVVFVLLFVHGLATKPTVIPKLVRLGSFFHYTFHFLPLVSRLVWFLFFCGIWRCGDELDCIWLQFLTECPVYQQIWHTRFWLYSGRSSVFCCLSIVLSVPFSTSRALCQHFAWL